MRVLCILIALAVLGCPPALAHAPDVPDPDRVRQLEAEAREASRKVAAARARLDAAVAAYERARRALEDTSVRLQAAERRLAQAESELEEAQGRLHARVQEIYRKGRVGLLDALLQVRTFGAFVRALHLTGAVLRRDGEIVDTVTAKRTEAERAKSEVDREVAVQRAETRRLESRQSSVMREMKAVAAVLNRARAELGSELGKFRFPVHAPYSYVDTWGAPRMTGTRYAHAHEGTDIFAPRGTPVVAVVGGTVERVGVAPLGGNKLWLRAPSGWTYYYAHLDGFASAARNGRRVAPGTVLGYVGNTGNARTTPPHLHFEIRRPDGTAINPYRTLKEAERAWSRL